MHLIFGGEYQGKLDYVKKTYRINDNDIFYCSDDTTEIDFSKTVIYGIDKYVLANIRAGKNAESEFDKIFELLYDKIIICNDVSQGIVPVDKQLRMWRESSGRVAVKLAAGAKTVTRIFAGLPLVLKTD